jgi:hypothetical protein
MAIITPDRMYKTLDTINEIIFEGRFITGEQRDEIVAWMTGRQYRTGANAGFFRPTGHDQAEPLRLFTGEVVKTHFATDLIPALEAGRALCLLCEPGPALESCLRPLEDRVAETGLKDVCTAGEFAHTTAAYIRYLWVRGNTRKLPAQLRAIHSLQDGTGRWARMPFYYTLFALIEIDHPLAFNELVYAAPACEQLLRKAPRDSQIDLRRRTLLERACTRIEADPPASVSTSAEYEISLEEIYSLKI